MTEKILVVEDEPAIADNIIYALSTEGFEPLWCSTGREALAALHHNVITLVILDIGLPDVNGFELAREMLKLYGVPIIFVTARSAEIDRVVGLELGADDYVVKPFSPRELTARVKAVLRRSSGGNHAPQAALRGDSRFMIDETRQRLVYHGVVLDLSRYEFRILRLLVRHPGRVYSRQQLMQQAWEEPEHSLERTVDTHIKTLRQKLKAIAPQDTPIVTYRGVGYALEEAR